MLTPFHPCRQAGCIACSTSAHVQSLHAWPHCQLPPVILLPQLNEADTIKVAVRVRPLFAAEKEKGAIPVLQVAEDNSYVKVRMVGRVRLAGCPCLPTHACGNLP